MAMYLRWPRTGILLAMLLYVSCHCCRKRPSGTLIANTLQPGEQWVICRCRLSTSRMGRSSVESAWFVNSQLTIL